MYGSDGLLPVSALENDMLDAYLVCGIGFVLIVVRR